MAKVTGIGGFFFKCKDCEALLAWYRDMLGIPVDEYGWNFEWKSDTGGDGRTVWGAFAGDSDYFNPSKREFMINLRVDDLDGMLAALAEKGVEKVGGIEDYPYGRFAWIMDPEGTKIELWQPFTEPTHAPD